MVFEKSIQYRQVEPAQAGFAPVARGFSRQATRRIAEYVFKLHQPPGE